MTEDEAVEAALALGLPKDPKIQRKLHLERMSLEKRSSTVKHYTGVESAASGCKKSTPARNKLLLLVVSQKPIWHTSTLELRRSIFNRLPGFSFCFIRYAPKPIKQIL